MIQAAARGLAAAVLVACLAGCSVRPADPYTGSAVAVENREDQGVEVIVSAGPASFAGFRIPPHAWMVLPGAGWTSAYRVDDWCRVVSAQTIYPIAPAHILILEGGSLSDYGPLDDAYPVINQPTLGPLSQPSPSGTCPDGPLNP